MQPAPFYSEVAEGPETGEAVWVSAADGVRLRIGLWPEGARGTVVLFPGRTEYIEKYGRTAGDLAALGFAMAAIDWRGQGLAERALDDRKTGHVMNFTDYQMDVGTLMAAVRRRGLPEPYYLIAHSMGGAIGLRALYNSLSVRAAVFSAPMWGISVAPAMRPVAWGLSWMARQLHLGHAYTPGTRENYVEQAPYEGNVLTADPEMFAYMQRQVAAHPDLSLGGPSLQWLNEALIETRSMMRMAAPEMPTLTFLGSNERVVDPQAVIDRMARWPDGRLETIEGAEHEVLMETPPRRQRIHAAIDAFFADQENRGSAG